MSDLTDFLLARIAEDEAVARSATPGPWITGVDSSDSLASRPMVAAGGQQDEAHIVRWNPVRVLAECAAKRAIVSAWVAADAAAGGYPGTNAGIEMGLSEAVYLLAQPYADHSDFCEEWRA